MRQAVGHDWVVMPHNMYGSGLARRACTPPGGLPAASRQQPGGLPATESAALPEGQLGKRHACGADSVDAPHPAATRPLNPRHSRRANWANATPAGQIQWTHPSRRPPGH